MVLSIQSLKTDPGQKLAATVVERVSLAREVLVSPTQRISLQTLVIAPAPEGDRCPPSSIMGLGRSG